MWSSGFLPPCPALVSRHNSQLRLQRGSLTRSRPADASPCSQHRKLGARLPLGPLGSLLFSRLGPTDGWVRPMTFSVHLRMGKGL